VLLHEELGCVVMWRDFPLKFAQATGFGVFAYSRLGYGHSDPAILPRPLSYMHDEAKLLPRVLDAAGVRRCVLLGHSDGASIAAIHAGTAQDFRVRGLILLAPHFFVEDIGVPVYRALDSQRGPGLEMCGTPANLAVAEYVHAYLTETSEQLWQEHKKALGLDSNRDRRVYLAGVMAGFAEKLARQAVKHKEEGLVWVKDADLGHFFRRRHPHIRHVRHTGARKNEAFAHGREAGKRIVLRKGVQGGTGARGHLLNAKNP